MDGVGGADICESIQGFGCISVSVCVCVRVRVRVRVHVHVHVRGKRYQSVN